jgi:hypothetical protein
MHRSEEQVLDGLLGIMLVGAMLLALAVVSLIVMITTELVRIFRERSQQYPQLWYALAGLLGVWLIAGLISLQPGMQLVGISLGCWAFCLFCIGCEVLDWQARRAEPTIPAEVALGDVVSWSQTA